MANIPALEAAIGYIEAHPESHDQDIWGMRSFADGAQEKDLPATALAVGECGTTGCLAGIAACQNLPNAKLLFGKGRATADSVQWQTGDRRHVQNVWDIAQSVLLLDDYEANALFAGANTLEDLKVMTKNLANGDPIYKGIDTGSRDDDM